MQLWRVSFGFLGFLVPRRYVMETAKEVLRPFLVLDPPSTAGSGGATGELFLHPVPVDNYFGPNRADSEQRTWSLWVKHHLPYFQVFFAFLTWVTLCLREPEEEQG
jgi:hypothetical protein